MVGHLSQDNSNTVVNPFSDSNSKYDHLILALNTDWSVYSTGLIGEDVEKGARMTCTFLA